MKKGLKGSMNIDFSEYYDEEDDIYYVTFKTGEPSGVLEMDDVLLLEVGVFTGLPTGFRILNYSKHKVGGVQFALKSVQQTVTALKKNFPAIAASRSQQVAQALEKTLAAA
ncbi:MAG TPA: hypothetical protein VNK24_12020 [Elusimicrobiota bacterium]|nr:hypothetical protein [Elusimicrobiota bacterium]